ncbi:MAG TPA: aldose 1-epimerase [Thermoleophilaceae bacterium]|nr:aldose 1-epimerase [Thermoleophilaceae bacterium]
MASHEAIESLLEGYPARTLISNQAELEVSFVPSVGMVGASMRHRGDELLGQRGGLARYEATRSTMGIPLLHPWANRLDGLAYAAAGRRVELDPDSPLLKTDPNDLPIHGFLGASPYWEVLGTDADDTSARLSARMDFAAHPEYLEGFPYPHELRIDASLAGSTLTLRTTLAATGDLAVPMSFGFHPYFALLDDERSDWRVELPVRERIVTDERQIPTGETEPVEIAPGPLGDRTFDDGYANVPDGARFVVAGEGRRVTVEWVAGYRYAQVYAPEGDELIAFEPMTAPTNALVSGQGLTLVPPGETRSATFSVTVE